MGLKNLLRFIKGKKEKGVKQETDLVRRHRERILEIFNKEKISEEGRFLPFNDHPGDKILSRGYRLPLVAFSFYSSSETEILELANYLEEKVGVHPDLGEEAKNAVLYFLPAPWRPYQKEYANKREYCLLISARTNDLRYQNAKNVARELVANVLSNKQFSNKEEHHNLKNFDSGQLILQTIGRSLSDEEKKLFKRG